MNESGTDQNENLPASEQLEREGGTVSVSCMVLEPVMA
jgi:hypothetical protein